MKNILTGLMFCLIIFTNSFSAFSQIIDYAGFTTSQCNSFYPMTVFSGLQHTTTGGTITYDNVNHAIQLNESANNNIYTGSEYKIGSTFKIGFNYTITINAWCSAPIFPAPPPSLRVDFTTASNGSGTTCSGPEAYNVSSSLTSINNKTLNSGAFFDYTFQFISLAQAQSFYILVVFCLM